MRTYGTLGLLLQKNVAELCNGSTYDSDSYCLGSNPSSAAKRKSRIAMRLFAIWKNRAMLKAMNCGNLLATFVKKAPSL